MVHIDLKPARPAGTDDRIGGLDVSILQKVVLDELLGIADPAPTSGSTSSAARAGRRARAARDSGRAAVAFSLYPVTVDDLMAIADAGGIMPPKSTWFEPKLRDGLLVHLI